MISWILMEQHSHHKSMGTTNSIQKLEVLWANWTLFEDYSHFYIEGYLLEKICFEKFRSTVIYLSH